MPGYGFENLVKAWTKSAFGLFVGWSFIYVFNSWFLAVIAWAFFFFIPVTNRYAENLINKSLFGGLMLFLLFWAFGVVGTGLELDLGISGINFGLGVPLFLAFAGFAAAAGITKKSWLAIPALIALGLAVFTLQPWNWNTSAILFVAVWIIGTAVGLSSDNDSRSTVGLVVLGLAFMLYTIGPGSQDVGVAFFGDWWPTIHNSVSQTFDPVFSAFSQLGKTFGDAWMLLTNPVGYATMLMNGSYQTNPGGLTGAYGVELTGFDVTPILIEQPFMITTNIKNSGARDARDVSMTLSLGSDSPTSSSSTSSARLNIKQLGIDYRGCEGGSNDYTCVHSYKSGDVFITQNIWQTVFSSSGIGCQYTDDFDVRKKYIPINVTLNYEYESDSKLDKLEIISDEEWERLARLDKIEQTDAKSEYTSGPVKFPIGASGLKMPIREDQDFHISVGLLSAQKGGRIAKIESVELTYPKELGGLFGADDCIPKPSDGPGCKKGEDGAETCKVRWTGGSGDRYFYCHIKAMKDKMGGSPTKTFVLTAHAEYTYSVSKEKTAKVEFGSFCCTQEGDKACASGLKCCPEPNDPDGKGICQPKAQDC